MQHPPTDHVTDNSSWEKYKKENSKSVEEAYGKRGPSSYTFKNPNDSKKFIKAAMNAGLNKKYIRVQKNKVTIDDIKNSDMEEMLYFMAKDMKATTR